MIPEVLQLRADFNKWCFNVRGEAEANGQRQIGQSVIDNRRAAIGLGNQAILLRVANEMSNRPPCPYPGKCVNPKCKIEFNAKTITEN